MPLMAHPPGSPWQLWPRLLSRTQPAIAAAASPVGLCPACAPVGGPDQTWAAGMEYKYEMTRCCHWGTGNWLGAVEVSKRPATNNMQIRRVMEPIGTMHIFIPNECQVTGRTARRSHSRPPRTCHPSHRPFRRGGWVGHLCLVAALLAPVRPVRLWGSSRGASAGAGASIGMNNSTTTPNNLKRMHVDGRGS